LLRLAPERAQTRPLAPAPVSTGGATRLLEFPLELELGPARQAHCHKTSAARARVRWLLP